MSQNRSESGLVGESDEKRRASSPPFFYVYCVSFNGRGLFTLTPTLSSERKEYATLTLALSPQGRGNL
jgi:hypothetical protein